MINRSPWLIGRGSAARMTSRTSNGIAIIQGKRALGQSNPSEQFLSSQQAASIIWPYFQRAPEAIRTGYTNVRTGRYAANEFYKEFYKNGMTDASMGDFTIQWADLLFTRGVMTPTAPTSIVADLSAGLVVNFPVAVADGSQSANDMPIIVVINVNTPTRQFGITDSGISRSDGSSSAIVLPPGFAVVSDVLKIYLGFRARSGQPNEGTSSNNTYSTQAVVA